MGLGLNTESGDFAPYLKFDARAGRWFRKGKEGEGEQVDVTDGFAAVFDLANIDVGYILFAAGAGPIYVVQPVAMGLPAKPGAGDYKQGFRLKVMLANHLGGGTYEVASTAKALIGTIDAMHTAFTAAPESQQGKLPVYKMAGSTVIETKGPNGTTRNYAPKMELVQWVDRPASLPASPANAAARTAPAPQPAQAAPTQPPATGSTTAAPPAAKPAAAPAELAFG